MDGHQEPVICVCLQLKKYISMEFYESKFVVKEKYEVASYIPTCPYGVVFN